MARSNSRHQARARRSSIARRNPDPRRARLDFERLEQREVLNADGLIYFTTVRDGNPEVYSMNPDGTNSVNLTQHAAKDAIAMINGEGTTLTFASDRTGNIDIYRMNIDGTGLVNLSNHPGYDYDPAPNEAGTKVAWVSGRSGNNEIWVANIDGSNPKNLTNHPGVDGTPNWSPDGTKIVFSSYRDNNQGEEIYIMNSDGTGQTRLTNALGRDFYCIFTPDGQKIAFTSSRDGHRQIYLMNLDGSEQVNISNSVWNDELPYFNYEGTKMSFVSNRDDPNGEIYVANVDGSGVTRITQNTFVDAYPAWGEDPAFEEPEIEIGNVTIVESDSGAIEATFTVTLSIPYDETITVDYTTADGTAHAGSDYAATSGTLSFAPGETSKIISVFVQGDLLVEADEAFVVNLSNPVEAEIEEGQGIGTIIDNDHHNPVFTSGATAQVAENTTLVLTVTATDDDLPTQTITFSLTGGADQSRFSITPQGVLTFVNAPNFEKPIDANADNIYLVKVTANDGAGGTATQEVVVSVTDVPELSDIRLVSATANGSTSFIATYEIVNFAAAAFELGVYSSEDALFGGDSLLATVVVSETADLTVGTHVKSWAIGSGANKVALPGAGATELGVDYYLLAVADPKNLIVESDGDAINEDNLAIFAGVYHAPNNLVLVHGGAGTDSVVISQSFSVAWNGNTYAYTAADVTAVRVRTHAGNDTVNGAALSKSLWASGGAGNDIVTGGSASDTLYGGEGNDYISGNGASDILVGEAGNDSLSGGLGEDYYVFDADTALGSDTLVETSGGGSDTLYFPQTTAKSISVNLSLATAQVVNDNLTLTLGDGGTFENVIGGSGDDVIIGNALINSLSGGPGRDRLTGAAGNDSLAGGEGNDDYLFDTDSPLGSDTLTEVANGGVDLLDFSQTTTIGITLDLAITSSQVVNNFLSLMLSSNAAFENVVGTTKNDVVRGNSLVNVLLGGAGNDSLSGLGGRDLLVGGTGADTLAGGDDDDLLISGTITYFNEPTAQVNRQAIDGIMAEWTRVDADYATRIARLRNGGGLNGTYRLDATTVFSDGLAVDSLYGGAGRDWFWKFDGDLLPDLDGAAPEFIN